MPIEWAPGDKWGYRNTNYVLLGIIIHKITGMPYAQFLGERIFKPLGMTSTRLISDRDIIPNRAAGYEIDATRRPQKPGVGLAHLQLHRGRHALLQRARPRQMGRGALRTPNC